MVHQERRIKSQWLCLLTWLVCLGACTGNSGGNGGNNGGSGCGGNSNGECQGDNCDKLSIPEGFPKTLVSAGKRTVTSSGQSAAMLVDGKFRGSSMWEPGRNLPAWVSIEVGGGISELLLSWTASANYDHPEIRYGAPASYEIQTSADSTDGENGTWVTPRLPTTSNPIVNNTVRTRTHCVPFANQKWLRFVVLSDAGTESGVKIDEIELHDNSDGKIDGWLFFGDSITAHAFDRQDAQNPAFATLMWAQDENHYPLQMNGGFGGDSARCRSDGRCSLDRLKQALTENDGIRVVALALGTNDYGAINDYREAMKLLIREAQDRGKRVIIPRIPLSTQAGRNDAGHRAMNQVVDELVQEFGLHQGPDFYAHFVEHPTHLRDDYHPNAEGCKAMNCLWAKAAQAVPKP